jgi:hypothetical protein
VRLGEEQWSIFSAKVGRYAKKRIKPKLLDLSLIMIGLPATLVMWWVISFAL